MNSGDSIRQRVDVDGYALLPSLIEQPAIDRLVREVESAQHESSGPRSANLRSAFDRLPSAKPLLKKPALLHMLSELLGPQAFAVRGILFDKRPDTNWKVAWHQDTAIPLAEIAAAEGFGPTSTKDGVPHTRAPAALLARMVTVRIHLDDCAEGNGPLRVIPGSHLQGRLNDEAIQKCRAENRAKSITAKAGDALVMRPLLLHASAKADTPRHRRVLHLEFAAEQLPEPLKWHACYRVAD